MIQWELRYHSPPTITDRLESLAKALRAIAISSTEAFAEFARLAARAQAVLERFRERPEPPPDPRKGWRYHRERGRSVQTEPGAPTGHLPWPGFHRR